MQQTAKRRARNVELKRTIKTAMKAFEATPSAKTLGQVQSTLDTAQKKGLLKKNTVARRKAHVAKHAKDAGVKLAATPKKPTAKKETKETPAKTAPAKKAPAKKPAAKKTTAKKAE